MSSDQAVIVIYWLVVVAVAGVAQWYFIRWSSRRWPWLHEPIFKRRHVSNGRPVERSRAADAGDPDPVALDEQEDAK